MEAVCFVLSINGRFMPKAFLRLAVAGLGLGLLALIPAWAETFLNPLYQAYPGPELIDRDLSGLDRVYRRHYSKFISYPAPNDGQILLIATNDVTDEQLVRAYNILDFFLTDVPETTFGADKSSVVQAMADAGAVLVLAGGSDGNSPVPQRALQGQPLYQLEFPVEGSSAYLESDYEQRDAGYEEIFHLVHDYGIGTKFSDGPLKQTYQAEITAAMTNARANGLWGLGDRDVQRWLRELTREGSLEQEYIASVLDSYYGLWGAWTDGPGGMWGVYAAKTREDVLTQDPMGAALVNQFLPKMMTYMARIDPQFSGTFEMALNPAVPYTHKSQYLLNVQLLGRQPAQIIANDENNILIGNAGDNLIEGRGGIDVVQIPLAFKDVQIRVDKLGGATLVSGPNIGTDTLTNIEILRFTDRDVLLSEF